jgi:acetylornithine deacetylase/succinyl-diaminopimelate desuccinylase-like protein
MVDSGRADAYVEAHYDEFVEDFKEFVAHPSVSATGEGIRDCAEYLQSHCEDYGFDETRIVETSWHPSVLARAFVGGEPDNEYPTLLIYGHYDVQPVDPEKWDTPPFEPVVKDGPDGRPRLFGRGSADNKGQMHSHLAAVRAVRETAELPMNITMLIDGEEESGSPSMVGLVEENEDVLDCVLALNSDGPIDESGRPHVVFGNRGILKVQIDVQGPNRDLHSGHNGGGVPNPVWELNRLLGSMKDESGRITVDGYYDDVQEITDVERDALEDIPFDAEALMDEQGIEAFDRGPGEQFFEKIMFYPTLNIAGISGGYQGEGFKTIVPATAQAKIDMRLVADQDPDDVWEKFTEHVEMHASDLVRTDVERLGAYYPNRTSIDSRFRDPIMTAVAEAWDVEPVLKPLTGGSAPYSVFTEGLDVDHIKVPYGQRDNNQHSPNENFALDNYEKGIRTNVRMYANIAAQS